MRAFVGQAVTIRWLRIPVLAVVAVVAACVGVAWAAGYVVHIKPPADAQVNTPYSITLKGSTMLPARLYLFVDYQPCGPNPAVEFARTRTEASGFYWTLPGGKFKRVSPLLKSSGQGTDHACAYLQYLPAKINGRHGIYARASVSYQIH